MGWWLVLSLPKVFKDSSSHHTHVSNGKSLYRLVLWGASRAVAASDGLDVAAAILVTSAVTRVSAFDHCFHMNPPREAIHNLRQVEQESFLIVAGEIERWR